MKKPASACFTGKV